MLKSKSAIFLTIFSQNLQNLSKTVVLCTEKCAFSQHFSLLRKQIDEEVDIRKFLDNFLTEFAQIQVESLKISRFVY